MEEALLIGGRSEIVYNHRHCLMKTTNLIERLNVWKS